MVKFRHSFHYSFIVLAAGFFCNAILQPIPALADGGRALKQQNIQNISHDFAQLPKLFLRLKKDATRSQKRTKAQYLATLNPAALANDTFVINLPQKVTIAVDTKSQAKRLRSRRDLKERHGTLFDIKNLRQVGKYSISEVQEEGITVGLYGVLQSDDILYTLEFQDGRITLNELDAGSSPGCAGAKHSSETFELTPAEGEAPAAESAVTPNGETIIDVMFAFSPEAVTQAGGVANLEAQANTAVVLTNQAYTNSLIPQQLNLVHTVVLTQSETGDFNDDLYGLIGTGDGQWDDVHTLRDQYGADLVSMFVANQQYCGIAYRYSGLESTGFSVVTSSCIPYEVVAHEMGHNMGAAHDRENDRTWGGRFSYSYGWRFRGNSGREFRTVMAYAPGARINYFSNPLVVYDGVATGVVDSADNALTLTNLRTGIAAFRTRPPTVPAAPSGLIAQDNQMVHEFPDFYQVVLKWQDNSDNEKGFRVEVGETANGPFRTYYLESPNSTLEGITGLQAGQTYYFRVQVFNDQGTAYSEVTSLAPSQYRNE